MNIPSIIWAVLYGLAVGFVVYLLLWALAFPPQPWAFIVGVLVFLACVFGGIPTRPIR